jgi:hypothetical protein
MSDRPARIVYAKPPGKSPAPYQPRPPSKRPVALLEPPRAVLSSSTALQAFHDLLLAWKLPPARGWRMLTGVGWQAGSLTPEQIGRVQHLVAIDAGLRAIRTSPGEWMVTTNPAPVLSGSAPVDYLMRTGTRGYEALAQQVDRWRGLQQC